MVLVAAEMLLGWIDAASSSSGDVQCRWHRINGTNVLTETALTFFLGGGWG